MHVKYTHVPPAGASDSLFVNGGFAEASDDEET